MEIFSYFFGLKWLHWVSLNLLSVVLGLSISCDIWVKDVNESTPINNNQHGRYWSILIGDEKLEIILSKPSCKFVKEGLLELLANNSKLFLSYFSIVNNSLVSLSQIHQSHLITSMEMFSNSFGGLLCTNLPTCPFSEHPQHSPHDIFCGSLAVFSRSSRSKSK